MTTFRVLSRTVTEISEDPTRAYRLDLELSPVGLITCPGVEWTPTAYYPPFLPIPADVTGDTFARTPGDIQGYAKGGVPDPTSTFNTWHFPVYRYAFLGAHELMVDRSHGVWGNRIFIFPMGDGEMTVYALGDSGVTFQVTLLTSAGDLIETVVAAAPVNTPYTFEISEARDGLCEHVVAIDFSYGYYGWDGFDWVQTGDTPPTPPGPPTPPVGPQPLVFPGPSDGASNVLSPNFYVPSGKTIRVNLTTVPSGGGNIGVICTNGTTNQWHSSPATGDHDFTGGYDVCYVYSWSYDSGRTGAGTFEVLP